jgi:hypothetical protein
LLDDIDPLTQPLIYDFLEQEKELEKYNLDEEIIEDDLNEDYSEEQKPYIEIYNQILEAQRKKEEREKNPYVKIKSLKDLELEKEIYLTTKLPIHKWSDANNVSLNEEEEERKFKFGNHGDSD